MPVEILIHSTNKPVSGAEKGKPSAVRSASDLVGLPWGSGEALPDYVKMRISDVDDAETVRNYLDNWRNVISYELIASNSSGRRYTLSMNPNVITEFGLDKGIRQEIHDYLQEHYGAVLVDSNLSEAWATYDIPNTDWEFLRRDILDVFEEQLAPDRYRFTEADVDLAIAAGGTIELTQAQVLARVIDRLA